jgi:hypothetical protein
MASCRVYPGCFTGPQSITVGHAAYTVCAVCMAHTWVAVCGLWHGHACHLLCGSIDRAWQNVAGLLVAGQCYQGLHFGNTTCGLYCTIGSVSGSGSVAFRWQPFMMDAGILAGTVTSHIMLHGLVPSQHPCQHQDHQSSICQPICFSTMLLQAHNTQPLDDHRSFDKVSVVPPVADGSIDKSAGLLLSRGSALAMRVTSAALLMLCYSSYGQCAGSKTLFVASVLPVPAKSHGVLRIRQDTTTTSINQFTEPPHTKDENSIE